MLEVETIIIGGGISGCAALHWLASQGKDALLLEQNEQLGGVIRSRRTGEGVLIESGPNSIQRTNPLVDRLIHELDLDDQILTAGDAARNRYVMRDGNLHALPSGPGSFLRTPLFSLSAKFRLLKEPFIASGTQNEESIASFVRRRIGAEFLDYAVNPFVSGIYAGNPEDLSVRHAFPLLHNLEQEYGSLIKGALKSAKKRKAKRKQGEQSKVRAGMISFAEGMVTLPQQIQKHWRKNIRTNSPVKQIVRTETGWMVEVNEELLEARHLILATPAKSAAQLIRPIDGDLATALERIQYPPVSTTVSLYKRSSVQHALDGFGVLFPETEQRQILGTIFTSTIFPDRAPEGTVALTTFIGGSRQPEIALQSPEELEALVHSELSATLGISDSPISFHHHLWAHAIPQYTLGYGRNVLEPIKQAEAGNPGLHLLGNYLGGISVGDCISSAHTLAESLE